MDSSDEERIWQVIDSIPRGRVASYGQVARLAALPGYARFVGRVLKQLPQGSNLPWHRVLRADGRIAFPAQSEDWRRQKRKLEDEDIVLLGDKVPMSRYAWLTD